MRAATPAAVLAGAVLLTACGRTPARDGPTSAPTPAALPVAAIGAGPIGRETALSAKVGGLRADVSGLERRETATHVVLVLAADTLFAFDRADLSPDAQANLGKVADAIRAGGPGGVVITGYTDAKGSPAYNQALSKRRAQAVANWMATQVGVRLRRLTVTGKGEADPVEANSRPDGSDNPEGRARNRRVEVSIPK